MSKLKRAVFQALPLICLVILGLFVKTSYVEAASYDEAVLFDNIDASLNFNDAYGGYSHFYSSDSMDIEIGDMDNDGHKDIMVATFYGAVNKIYWNNGDGTWTEADEFGASSTWELDLADFNDDGFLDVMVVNYGSFFGGTSSNFLYINNGDRTFTAENQFGAGRSTDAYIDDINQDSLPDVVVPNSGTNYTYTNNGDGTFTAASILGSGNTMELDLFDLDKDGDLDALKGEYSGTSTYRINNGDGTWTSHAVTSSTVSDMEPIDFDNDDDWDFIVALHGQNLLYVNNGDGTWTPQSQFGSYRSNDLIIEDLDGNGYTDVVVANGAWGGSEPNFVYYNNGDGTWVEVARFGVGSTYDIEMVDIDNDGDRDCITSNWNGIDYIYFNGYFDSSDSWSFPVDRQDYFDSWVSIESDEAKAPGTSIYYSIYSEDDNGDDECSDETLILARQQTADGIIDLSSVSAEVICIYVEMETDLPSSSPTLSDMVVNYRTYTSSLSGQIWVDENENGLREAEEVNIEGATVYLYDADDNLVAETLTDSTGNYIFEDLLSGDYYIVFELSDEYGEYSPADTEGADNDFADLRTEIITLERQTDITSIDGAVFPPELAETGVNILPSFTFGVLIVLLLSLDKAKLRTTHKDSL